MTTSSYPGDDIVCEGDQYHIYLVIRFSPTGSDSLGSELIPLLTPLVHNSFLEHCGNGNLLIKGPQLDEADHFLVKLTSVLDCYNQKKDLKDRAEIVETRARGVSLRTIPSTFAISDRFTIVSPEGNASPRTNQIILDAGNSFGSGYHPSTKLAVKVLESIAEKSAASPCHVIDVGCGSGILSIINIHLGARTVLGLEIDKEAIENARKNVSFNHMEERITLSDKAISAIDEPADLICANLIISVMLTMFDDFKRLLRPGGWLVLSGIQGRQAGECTTLLEKLGFSELERFQDGAWCSLLLRKK